MPKKKPEPTQPQLFVIARSEATRRSMDDHEPSSTSLSFTIEPFDDPETGQPTQYGRFSRSWQDEEALDVLIDKLEAEPRYVLVCGEGRLNAFRILGETHIPALVVDMSDEDAFIMSLAENIARRGYGAEIIIQKTGLSPKYVEDITFLLDQGEERLIEGVQRGTIPLILLCQIPPHFAASRV